ncbi:FHF complex subunit HOOK-interacting protein 2B isoform X3 [Myripristis murdjan]|uniref:FHF complex subunit HOOK-interacting protein 2B isoform X3 n=1 Tax=Myripristis murdjan TaxID=586833 RepID=UPI0011763596|nr:protein FAM160B2-like isoform X3 [Myripristis murdjan]
MEALSKLGGLLLHALETREPSVDLLESFVDHWKAITNYYIETTDESRPVRQTDIPWRLRQMLDILVYEEKQQGVEETGPCLEYLLQHKILETLCTLGKAQYPPGMSQQVLLFISKFLSQIQKPLLHLISVYRPVQKLIRLCALPGSHTEKEEAQFLLVVCSRVKQDPYVLHYVLELPDQSAARTSGSAPDQSEARKQASNHMTETDVPSNPSGSPMSSLSPASSPDQSECSASSPNQSESSVSSGLLFALVQLTKSQKSSVRLKACSSLLLLCSLQAGEAGGTEGSAGSAGSGGSGGSAGSGGSGGSAGSAGSAGPGEVLAERSPLAVLLAGRLVQLHGLLPLEQLEPRELQGWQHTPWSSQFSQSSSDGTDHVTNFFCWLDFLDHLMKEAPQVLAVRLAQAVHQAWLLAVLQPQLLQMAEPAVLLSTALLSAVVRLVQSAALLDQLVLFLLGPHTHTHTHSHTHTLRERLLERCDHISDQISMASLCLVEELLQKPHEDILTILVLRNLESRSYLSLPPAGVEERPTADPAEENEDLEEDPFFSDSMFSDSQLLPPPLSCPASSSASSSSSGQGSAADVVNSFLCLVPQQARSAHLLQGGGYDSYVHDAHSLVKECLSLSQSWDWPDSLPPPSSSVWGAEPFSEGSLLKVLLDRLGRILEQPYELNLQLTSILSRLSAFQHPLLQEYLLNPYISLSHCCRSPFSVLIRVIGELMQKIQLIPNLTDRLVNVRKQLLGVDNNAGLEHLTLLRGVIVLEEFCKELAAIAFVKLPLNHV